MLCYTTKDNFGQEEEFGIRLGHDVSYLRMRDVEGRGGACLFNLFKLQFFDSFIYHYVPWIILL